MKPLVVDASTALGFLLEDERSPQALQALTSMQKSGPTYVPAHWWVEMTNGLLLAERRGRASQMDIGEALRIAKTLPVTIDDQTANSCGGPTLALARQFKLTMYDAAYIELALRTHAAFATLDRALARAARTAGLEILS